MEFLNQIEEIVKNNQILTTVAGGSVIVWIVSNIRMIFSWIINSIVTLVSFNITNYYEDNRALDYVLYRKQTIFNNMISESKALWEKNRNLDLSTTEKNNRRIDQYGNSCSDCVVSKNTLLYGFSIRWFMGSLCFVYRSVKNNSQKIIITTDIRVFFANKSKFINKLENKISESLKKAIEDMEDSKYTVVSTLDSCTMKYKRHIDSIFTNNNEHYDLLNDIKGFIANKETYERLNYPYKYSALIHGKPGCGKSSTILSIASELNKDIVYINMATVSSGRLMELMQGRSVSSIFVFEDIDAIAHGTSANRDNSVNGSDTVRQIDSGVIGTISSISLADILNITDGLLSNDGAICIFTTNHIEKLDPALLRAGRMNKIVEFTYLNPETANRMIKAYLDIEIENLKDVIKPAELQEEILQVKLGKSTVENLRKKFTK